MFPLEYIMAISKFFNKIQSAKEEREVEDVYNEGISLYFLKDDGIIEHPYKCDGLVDKGLFLKLIIEYKYDEDLHNAVSRAKVLTQVIFYLKQFELNGERLPNVLMVGDINEVFVMHTNPLLKYLDENIDWKIAPSCAHDKNVELVLKISNDDEISPYVYDIDEYFSFKNVADKINEIATNTVRKVRVTEHNISKIFDDFTKRVLKNSYKILPNDLVGIFISSIIDRDNCYQHPNNENKLVCHNHQYDINGKYYKTFFSHFEKEYSPEDKNKFTEISDRLIEDTKRRRSGEFYTPTIFTDYAHKMLSEELGEDWKEKYVVWDCCWGTGNLTRDYQFKELYASTLEQAELDCGKRYNSEATKFVFDFLNETIENMYGWNEKIPIGLRNAFKENKPIIFFINPPYATSTNVKKKVKGNRVITDTGIGKKMKMAKLGQANKQLYAQFLYRICLIKKHYNLSNIHIGLFSPTLYLMGDYFKEFRREFFDNFSYKNGVLFCASHFADVKNNWGISFSIWNCGKNTDDNNFKHKLINNIDDEIKVIGEKNIYNTDDCNINGCEWVNSFVKKIKTYDVPQMSTAINVRPDGYGRLCKNAFGYYYNVSNIVEKNATDVAIFTSTCSCKNGYSILEDNFIPFTLMFSARKLIQANWINGKDNYLIPNFNHEAYQVFEADSIVFSLFNTGSNQSSLRNIEYKGKNWNIKNEFFFMQKNEIMNLANENNFDFTYNDARVSEERYVYKRLKEITLSKEAQDVLDKAIELTKKSFKYRELFNQEHPEYQIMNWDCGWYQIKAVLKEYFSEDLKEFQELYKILADKMRPMVYELGFLK